MNHTGDSYTDDTWKKLVPDKKFYLGMDAKRIDNPAFHDPWLYPILALERDNHIYTPQVRPTFHDPWLYPFLDIAILFFIWKCERGSATIG